MDRVLPTAMARFQSSPNRGGRFSAGRPDTLVIHYTAGASLQSSVTSLCDPATKASAHLVVGRDGTVVQLVEFDIVAWHAGASRHGDRVGLNAYSIGIEIDNAGRLTQNAAGDFVTWFGKQVPKSEAILATHRNESTPGWWHAYTQVQLEKVFELAQLLVQGLGIKHVVGHEEIAPGRKSDPGPAFPLERLRARVLGAGRDSDMAAESDEQVTEGLVAAKLLNLRSRPSVTSPVVGVPLSRGTAVAVIGSQAGWLRINRPVPAWVKREFVQLAEDVSAASQLQTMSSQAGPNDPADTDERTDTGGVRPSGGSGARPDPEPSNVGRPDSE